MHEPAFATLVEMLRHRARRSPETTAFTFAGRSHPFALLWERAGRFASLLMAGGVGPGDHVLMALPNGPEFFYAFYGALRAGAAAVPIFPRSGVRRITDMASLSRSAAIVAPSDYPETRWARLKAACQGRDILLVRRFDGPPVDGSTRFPTAAPEDIAYIQYTSGSTGDPKGVRLSHANLMTNVTQLIDGMRITPADCFVSWLPVHHDMGLILKTLTPFYLKAPLHLLPTRLTHVHTWLDAIQTHRATFTAAPDFAWRLLNRYVRDPGAYDLSSLRVALNAAEPVRAGTIADFESRFNLGPTMVAGYGLAEATVGVSMWPPQTPNKVDDQGVASVGPPFRDIRVRIIRHGVPVGPGRTGEITVNSPANTRGYFRNPSANERLWAGDGFIATGDLGYLDEAGNLYVAGRKKSMMIVAGRTIAPREVEEIVDQTPRVRFCAAVGIDSGGLAGEQIHVFAEARADVRNQPGALEDLALGIVRELHQRLGVRPGRVILLKSGAIPRTQNGKIRHQALKQKALTGLLRQDGLILFPDY